MSNRKKQDEKENPITISRECRSKDLLKEEVRVYRKREEGEGFSSADVGASCNGRGKPFSPVQSLLSQI